MSVCSAPRYVVASDVFAVRHYRNVLIYFEMISMIMFLIDLNFVA